MRKTLLVATLSVLSASCTSGSMEQLRKENDSLQNELTNLSKRHMNGIPDTVPRTDDPALYYIPFSSAEKYVDNWDTLITRRNAPHGFSYSRSFIVPISNMQHLIQQGCSHVIFYLSVDTFATNASDTISLVYLGGIETAPHDPGKDSINIIAVDTVNGIPQAFDNTWPCPVCDVKGFAWNATTVKVPFPNRVVNNRKKK